jgi:hypothetical protein
MADRPAGPNTRVKTGGRCGSERARCDSYASVRVCKETTYADTGVEWPQVARRDDEVDSSGRDEAGAFEVCE